MAVWRALIKAAGIAVRVFALTALVLGPIPGQAAASVPVSPAVDTAVALLPLTAPPAAVLQAQDGPPYTYHLPLLLNTRDDLLMAESSLPVIAVSAGYAHACAIRPGSGEPEAGELICWGLNDDSQAAPVPGLYTQVSAGGSSTCGLRSDGSLVCWGDNTYGQATVPAGTYTQVSTGGQHACALRADESIACWGSNALGQLNDIPGGAFVQVSAGNAHTCARRADGSLACWGSSNYGQSTAPAGAFSQVSAGGFHSCAVSASGAVTCWGSNDAGQSVVPAGTYAEVAAGYLHTCARSADGSLACWGSNGFGQLNDLPAGAFTQVSAGGNHTCAVRDNGTAPGTLACWGWNRYGQSFPPSGVQVSVGEAHTCALLPDGSLRCFGDNTYGQSTPPAGIFHRLSAGSQHTCAVGADGTLACWGDNAAGQSAAPAGTFLDASAGGQHACALDLNGALVCWGANDAGQTAAPAGEFTRLDAGAQHNCALNAAGEISCWGSNANGQAAAPAGTFTQVSAGGRHSCALNVQGQLTCWGDDAAGQSAAPLGTFAEVSAGLAHSCALSALGALTCWGDNTYGQSAAPAGVYTHVSAGSRTSCAVNLDGALTCWGGVVTPVISLAPETLPDAVEGQPYSQALTASGGEAPYTFTVLAGALPAGLTLSPDGTLSGTPELPGSYTFTVQAADSASPAFTGQRQYTLRVAQVGDTTPPVIVPRVSGTLGKNHWYISAVTVAWEVSDPESPVTATEGCEETTLTEDTTGQTLTCSATSAGGTSRESVTIKIDQTPPANVRGEPEREPDKDGWYNHPLTVTFTGEDATSGIDTCTETTYDGPDSANASVTGTCTDNAGNVSEPAAFTFRYDETAPTLHPVVQPNPVILRGKASVKPNAYDETSGLAAVECGKVDTSEVGEHTVTCRAVDKAGNTVSASARYNVIYQFDGFLPPVKNPPFFNRVTAGQTVPLKFRLYDAFGKPVTDLETFEVRLEFITCPSGADLADIEALYLPDVTLNQGGGLYHFNWQTSKTYAGRCKRLSIDLGEGIDREAFFWFK